MPVDVQKEGRFELFETTKGHRILVFDNSDWFAWVEGQRGEILVASDSDHRKERTLQKGKFYIVEFRDDPEFKDMPHLFLERDGHFEESMLPQGLPDSQDRRKQIVATDKTLGRNELEEYLAEPAPAGRGEKRMERPKGGSMSNVVHYLQGIDFPASGEQAVEHARKNDAPKKVVRQLEKATGDRYETMADLTEAIGGKSDVPISNYDELNAGEIKERLDKLSKDEIRRLYEYEKEHVDRKNVEEELERRLAEAD